MESKVVALFCRSMLQSRSPKNAAANSAGLRETDREKSFKNNWGPLCIITVLAQNLVIATYHCLAP